MSGDRRMRDDDNDIYGEDVPSQLKPVLGLIRALHNKLARYIDARVDEAGDGTRMLVRHIEARQIEVELLRARIVVLENRLAAYEQRFAALERKSGATGEHHG